MALLCGIDEAGRGPIVGPMVLAGVLIDEEDEQKLKRMGVKDSKLLTIQQREDLFEGVKNVAKGHVILSVPPQEVDEAVNGKDGLNLNRLEAKHSAKILNELHPERAIIDAPGNNIPQYTELIRSQLVDKRVQLVVEHKADLNHPVVGAASILAKVTRDKAIVDLKKELNIDFGSGYLSDPKTAKFLEEHWETHADVFRKSWMPYKTRMSRQFQQKLAGFTEFLEEVEDKHKDVLEKLKKLEDYGYEFIPTSTEHEKVRMKGACTITLYKNGRLLIQGKEDKKRAVEKILGR